ncbi:MAG: hypothetical protein ACRDRC_01550, partial [Pseudonocardiaceae bacterium]
MARTDLLAAVARNQAYRQAAVVGGPPLGGLQYAVAQSLPFLINAVSYLISYLMITAIRIPLQESREPREHREPMRRRLLDGLRRIFGEQFLRTSVLYVAAFNFVQLALVLTVIVRATSHGASAGGFLLAAIGSTGSLLVLTAVTATVVVAASTSAALRVGGRV